MSMLNKKKVKPLEPKKTLLTPLIKCYICNQHFEAQSQYDLHIKQHQNKINRTTPDEIQRKTQQNFAKKKLPMTLNKTQTQLLPQRHSKIQSIPKDTPKTRKYESSQEKQQKEIGEALRESQILLEKIEFMTQISPPQDKPSQEQVQEEEPQFIEKTIKGERKLNQLILKADNKSNIEKLILQTEFENRYFQNYQLQLQHLRILALAAKTPASIGKIMEIRKKICRDVCQQLEDNFGFKQVSSKQKITMKIDAKITANEGSVKYCADCYSQIGGTDDLYQLQCGHCYHPQCWNGECCS